MTVSTNDVTYTPPGRINFNWISEAWEIFKANAGTWILVALFVGLPPFALVMIVEFGFGIPPGLSGQPQPPDSPFSHPFLGQPPLPILIAIYIVLELFMFFWQGYFQAGVMRLAVSAVRGGGVRFGDLFATGVGTFRMIGLVFLGGLAWTIGFVLCFIPGFAIAGMLMAAPAMIGDGVGTIEAMQRSIGAIKRDWLNAAALVFIGFLLVILSELPLGLGLLVTIPMAWIVSALAYRDMVGMPGLNIIVPSAYGTAQQGIWPPPPSINAPPPTWPPSNEWTAAPPTPPQAASWPPAADAPDTGEQSDDNDRRS